MFHCQDRNMPFDRIRSEEVLIPIDQCWQSLDACAEEYTRA
jgi:hypothetical protein